MEDGGTHDSYISIRHEFVGRHYVFVFTNDVKPVKRVTWHRKGDYLATVCPDGTR